MIADQKPCRTVRRTSRTEWRFLPSAMAIIGMTAETRPIEKIISV